MCGAGGVFCAQAVVVLGTISEGAGIVGQCPRCLTFVCSNHSELAVCHVSSDDLAELQASIEETGFVPVVLCCPFHHIPLGRADGEYRLFLERQSSASDERKRYAREYTQNPALYTRRTRGFDFSAWRLTREGSTDWPAMVLKESNVLNTLKGAFNAFDTAPADAGPIHSDIRELGGGGEADPEPEPEDVANPSIRSAVSTSTS